MRVKIIELMATIIGTLSECRDYFSIGKLYEPWSFTEEEITNDLGPGCY